MSPVPHLGDMLDKAFSVALLLTGGVASAEKAIERAIERAGRISQQIASIATLFALLRTLDRHRMRVYSYCPF